MLKKITLYNYLSNKIFMNKSINKICRLEAKNINIT